MRHAIFELATLICYFAAFAACFYVGYWCSEWFKGGINLP